MIFNINLKLYQIYIFSFIKFRIEPYLKILVCKRVTEIILIDFVKI